jgi:hypothetical protein
MMHTDYQTLEIDHKLKLDMFQMSSAVEEDQKEANSLGEFVRAGLTAFFLMVGLSAAVYFFLFLIVAFGLGQFG